MTANGVSKLESVGENVVDADFSQIAVERSAERGPVPELHDEVCIEIPDPHEIFAAKRFIGRVEIFEKMSFIAPVARVDAAGEKRNLFVFVALRHKKFGQPAGFVILISRSETWTISLFW